MFIKYKDILYDLLEEKTYLSIITRNKLKSNEDFLKTKGSFYKNISLDDINIQDIFEVDFVLTYIDTSETTKHGTYETRWNVNEGKAMHKSPVIEKDEVGLTLPHDSWSEDWIQDDKYSCSKIVNLCDCSEYTVIFTYEYKDGKKLEKPLVEEKQVMAEEFKEEMIKYRKDNI